jgi:hypothetical protein
MLWARNLLKIFRLNKTNSGKALQEEADLHKLYLLLEWDHLRHSDGRSTVSLGSSSEQIAERLNDRALRMDINELRDNVKGRVAQQVAELAEEGGAGFKLSVRPTGIPGAGMGVFVSGEVSPGRVVALMPGLIYYNVDLRDLPGYPSFGKESDFLMSRYDGSVVDSRAWTCFMGTSSSGTMREYNAKRRKRAGLDYEALLDHRWFRNTSKGNKYAFGHVINHPPKSVAPNVLAAPVDWREKDIGHLPWSLYKSKAPISGEVEIATVPGLAFVATRAIDDGEELLVNYRLNPGVLGGLPKWYHAVNEEEDLRRWD